MLERDTWTFNILKCLKMCLHVPEYIFEYSNRVKLIIKLH